MTSPSTPTALTFGDLLKDARIASEITLRKASVLLKVDVGILSKIERGLDPAPNDQALVAHWADLLALKGQPRGDFLCAAAVSAANGPGPLPTERDVDEHMPLFPIRGITPAKTGLLRGMVRQCLTPTAHLQAS